MRLRASDQRNGLAGRCTGLLGDQMLRALLQVNSVGSVPDSTASGLPKVIFIVLGLVTESLEA